MVVRVPFFFFFFFKIVRGGISSRSGRLRPNFEEVMSACARDSG